MESQTRYWTPEQTEYLIKNYSGSQSAPVIALRLGVPPAAAGRKARALGFSRTENRRAGWRTIGTEPLGSVGRNKAPIRS